jgi:hypothetical protein
MMPALRLRTLISNERRTFMRILRTAARTLLALLLGGTGTAAAAGSTSAAGPAACSGTLSVTQTFSQAGYTPGQNITVTVTAVNCTDQALSTHLTAYGRFADASGNLAQGCPVIDPLYNPVSLAPNGTYTTSIGYTDFTGCLATQFEAFDNFSNDADGTQLAAATASVPIVQATPPYGCHVVYTRQSEWQGGFTSAISITNTGQAADNNWTLTYTFGGDQKVGNVWGATATQAGRAVTLANLPWDATIAAGATINVVGMTGTWTASDAAPSGFAINGVACS